jgi:hypothetical protein
MKHTQHEAQKDKTVLFYQRLSKARGARHLTSYLLPGVCLLQCNGEKPVCRMERVNQGTVCRNVYETGLPTYECLPVEHVRVSPTIS